MKRTIKSVTAGLFAVTLMFSSLGVCVNAYTTKSFEDEVTSYSETYKVSDKDLAKSGYIELTNYSDYTNFTLYNFQKKYNLTYSDTFVKSLEKYRTAKATKCCSYAKSYTKRYVFDLMNNGATIAACSGNPSKGFYTMLNSEDDITYEDSKDTSIFRVSTDIKTGNMRMMIQSDAISFETLVSDNEVYLGNPCSKVLYKYTGTTDDEVTASSGDSVLTEPTDEKLDIFILTTKNGTKYRLERASNGACYVFDVAKKKCVYMSLADKGSLYAVKFYKGKDADYAIADDYTIVTVEDSTEYVKIMLELIMNTDDMKSKLDKGVLY